jgi:hypothetical protein
MIWINYYGFVYAKIDLNTSSLVWANLLSCTSGSCVAHYGVAAISNDNTKAYSLSTMTDNSKTILWLAFDFSSGSLYGSRYMTQTNVDFALAIVSIGDYVYIILSQTTPKNCLGRYDPSTGKFDTNWFCTSYTYLRMPLGTNPNFDTDPRIHILGQYGSNGCVIVKTTWGK